MGLSTWLKERRLARTHQKLKHLRALQSRIRDQEEDVRKAKRAAAGSAALEAKERKLHEEREKLTRQIHELTETEDALKRELKAAA